MTDDAPSDEQLAQARTIILRLGRMRFGTPDPGTITRVGKIRDPERLKRMAEKLIDVGNWNELLDVR